MKKTLSFVIPVVSIIVGISAVSIPVAAYANRDKLVAYKDAAMTQEVEHTHSDYKINANGQTYGIGDAEYIEDLPDLMSAMGDNGNLGYIYTSDLLNNKPSTPEEAVAYQKALESGEYTPRVINVYESDGKTVIDTLTETLPDPDKIEIRKK